MNKTKLLLILVIAIFLEIIVFNITSYRTFFGEYEVKSYDNPKFLYSENNKAYVEIENINMKVATLKLELKNIEDPTEYTVFYSDETSEEYWRLTPKMYIESNEKTKYMTLYLSGETRSIMLSIDEQIYNEGNLNRIILNEKIPFEFNFIRFIVVLGILLSIYFIKNTELFKENYSQKSLKQELVLLGILGVFLLISSLLNVYAEPEGETSKYLLLTTNEGIYNKEFVDALKEGKLYLLEDPSENFLNLKNPYDTLVRQNLYRGIDYKWDTAFFNGHQYIYFGILPAILIFLPFNLLTHKYLKTSIACLGFSILIFILLKEILLKIFQRYFKEIPFKNVVFSLIILLSGTLILYANANARVYEIVIIAGLYFILQGIYFILKSLEEEKNRHLNIFFGSLFLALSVACRPTDLFVSVLILPYLIDLLIKYIKNIKEKKIDLIKLIFAVAIPYLTVGIALMIYNYVRFGNVFDFGYKYQLTINNNMALGNRLFTIPVGIICNFFMIPRFIPDFPFITHTNEAGVFNGYYYIEDMIGGLFMVAPICFAIFFIIKANKIIKNKELKTVINSLTIVGIFIAIISVVMAGSVQRYLIDYAWIIILAGILIFMAIYEILKSEEAKKILQFILCTITIYTFVISILLGIISEKNFMKDYFTKQYYNLKYTVCFWE